MSDRPLVLDNPPEVALPYPRRFRPVATLVILGLNFIMFALMTLADFLSRPPLSAFLLRTFTGMSADPSLLVQFGACLGPYIRRGEYWRLVMPMFLHIGLLHLLLNNYALYVLGPFLERVYGYGRFALIYVVTGIGSFLLSMTRASSASAGASGAVFGIAGAMLVTGYLHRDAIPRRWGRAFGKGIFLVIVLNLLLGFVLRSFIDNRGHLGGLVTGMLLAGLIPPLRPEEGYETGEEQPFQSLVLVPALVVVLATGVAADHYRSSRAVERLLQEGARLRVGKLPDRAAARYREAARLAPKDERPHEGLGSIFLEQERLPEAAKEFGDALRFNSDSTRAQLGMAVISEQTSDAAGARKYFESATGQDTGTAEGQELIANLCLEERFFSAAIRHYEQALRLKPDLATAQNNLAWLLATCEDTRLRDPKQALEHARSAVALTRWKEGASIDTLAEALFVNGKFKEAVEVETRALVLEPNNQEYKDHMARYRKAAGA